MSVTLGKRKRSTPTVKTSTKVTSKTKITTQEQQEGKVHTEKEGEDEQILQEIFRRHFEQRFDPLSREEVGSAAVAIEVAEEDDIGGLYESEDESEWDGLSADEGGSEKSAGGVGVVEVVEHRDIRKPGDWGQDRADLKAFMSSRPPSSTNGTGTMTKSSGKTSSKSLPEKDDDDGTEAMNMKHDIALQRLLSESHLLTSSSSSTSPSTDSLAHAGKARHKALDLRLQSLGAKKSMFTSQKMPMEKRQGIASHRAKMESKRRLEAKENGIILEKEKRVRSKNASKVRDRGVGGPGVGKMRGGMLTLSRKDVLSIQGSGGGGRGGKRSGGMKKFGI